MATTSMISINMYPPALERETAGFFITQYFMTRKTQSPKFKSWDRQVN
jgi:hypothetical protein